VGERLEVRFDGEGDDGGRVVCEVLCGVHGAWCVRGECRVDVTESRVSRVFIHASSLSPPVISDRQTVN
jgi:uncharacterized Fe-S radical SAM superfamily protein PflX